MKAPKSPREAIIQLLSKSGPMSRKMLTDWTKQPAKIIGDTLKDMIAAGDIEEDPDRKTTGGGAIYRLKKE